jgi:hypothetical protein
MLGEKYIAIMLRTEKMKSYVMTGSLKTIPVLEIYPPTGFARAFLGLYFSQILVLVGAGSMQGNSLTTCTFRMPCMHVQYKLNSILEVISVLIVVVDFSGARNKPRPQRSGVRDKLCNNVYMTEVHGQPV